MKNLFVFLFIISGLVLHAQMKKDAVIKTNGDTIWCDHCKAKGNAAGKVKTIEYETGKSSSEIASQEVAFMIRRGVTYIVTPEGYVWQGVILWGKNYYLLFEAMDDPTPGASPGTQIGKFHVMDKNREYIKDLSLNENELFPDLEKYFGDCDEFVKEIHNLKTAYSRKTYIEEVKALAEKYKSSCPQ